VHQRGEILAGDLLIYLAGLRRILVADAHFLCPLPTAAVAHNHEYVFTFGSYPLWQLGVYDFHTLAHLLIGYIQTFKGLYKYIAKIMVESFLNPDDFLLTLLWEGALEVFSD
jgi:hypothetical protein